MQLSRDDLIKAYRRMRMIREFEDAVHDEFSAGNIPGFVHLYAGEEASGVGVCMHLEDRDVIASTHRGHGHCIAKGCDEQAMMREIFGKKDGLCGGKGGSMHIADLSKGMMGANGIVGGGPPLICGAALTAKTLKTGGVAIAFVGEGATSNGVWHEALNCAGVHSLPVVFIVQDNLWAESVPKRLGVPLDNLADRAKAYGFAGVTIDGNDLMACYETSQEAVRKARRGEGPTLIEMKTYRWYGHSEIDPANYRTSEELEMWKKRDPVPRFEKLLMERGVVDEALKQATLQRIEREIEEAIEFAEKSPHPDPSEIMEDVYAPLN